MKNEGDADDFQIHELLLRLSDRDCYQEFVITGMIGFKGLLSKSKNEKFWL